MMLLNPSPSGRPGHVVALFVDLYLLTIRRPRSLPPAVTVCLLIGLSPFRVYRRGIISVSIPFSIPPSSPYSPLPRLTFLFVFFFVVFFLFSFFCSSSLYLHKAHSSGPNSTALGALNARSALEGDDDDRDASQARFLLNQIHFRAHAIRAL